MSSQKRTRAPPVPHSKKSQNPIVNTQVRVDDRPRDVKEWQGMLVNPGAVNPVRTPSVFPYTGAVRTFVRTFTVQSNGANDPFNLIFNANITNSLMVQRAAPFVLDPAGWSLLDASGLQVDITSTYNGQPTAHGDFNVQDSTDKTVGVYSSAWDPVHGVPFLSIIGDSTTRLLLDYSGTGTAISVYYKVGAAWFLASTLSVRSRAATMWMGPFVGGFEGVMITVSNPTNIDGNGLKISQSSGTDPVLGATSSYDLFATDATQLGKVSSFRVTAASLLASYSGNELENGGVIAAARTRQGYKYETIDPYTSLTKLQDHSYRGVLKTGAYTWWLPYDFEEIDPRPVYHSQNGTALHVAGHFDSADASLEVTLVMVVEFYSPLQIFEHQPGPVLDDTFVRAYHALDYSPAATCNPKHSSILKKALSTGASVSKGLAKFVLANPELLSLLAA